jgi:hypothetical protein
MKRHRASLCPSSVMGTIDSDTDMSKVNMQSKEPFDAGFGIEEEQVTPSRVILSAVSSAGPIAIVYGILCCPAW